MVSCKFSEPGMLLLEALVGTFFAMAVYLLWAGTGVSSQRRRMLLTC